MAITYKEMYDTFNALEKTADYIENRWEDIEAFFRSKDRFVYVGCGSSYSNAKSFAMICAMGAGKSVMTLAAGDILLHAERYVKCLDGAAVVMISRSGRTSELLLALDALKEQGCNIAVASIVCADDTPLGERSDLVLSTPWAFDESVCQTRCVTNFYYLAAYIGSKIVGDTAVLSELRSMIKDGPAYIEKAEALAKELAKQPWTHAVVLADAELEGIAEEGALVYKEVCQLPSNYYHLLDVRHGPMVLIGKETLVVVILGKSNELEINLIKDLIAKKAQVVVFSDVENQLAELEGIKLSSYGKPLSHAAKGVPLIILNQMIAYYKSKETGTDPDNPTGLDPWISL